MSSFKNSSKDLAFLVKTLHFIGRLFQKLDCWRLENDPSQYKLCQKFFNIFNTGHQALVNNFSWKKHKEHLKRVVLSPRAVTAIIKLLEKLSPTLSKVQTTTDVSLTNAETLKAEIIWSLYCVKNCYSNKILNELDNTFSKMFSGSNIAKSFLMGRSK